MPISARLIILCTFLLVQNTLAQSDGSSTVLPSSLTDAIPACSTSCLEDFVSQNYPNTICPNLQDIDCLCSKNTTSGFTLGEAALRCVASWCPNVSTTDAGALQVCTGVKNALPNTHPTITATLMAATTISVPLALSESGFPSSLPASINSPTISLSLTSITTATGSPIIPTSSSIPTTSTLMTQPDPQTASSTSTPAPVKSGTLTTSQIAGIAVAGVASAAFAFGALILVFCLRRRRRLRHQGDQLPFEFEKPQNTRPRPSTPTNHPGDSGVSFGGGSIQKNQAAYIPPAGGEKRRSFFRKSIKPEEIGVAVSPEIAQEESPASVASHRTTSQLLPEKPSYTLFPGARRQSRQQPRPESTATEFEEDLDGRRRSILPPALAPQRRNPMQGGQWVGQHGLPARPGPPPADARAMMYAMERGAAPRQYHSPPPVEQPRYLNDIRWPERPDDIVRPPPPVAYPKNQGPGPVYMNSHLEAPAQPRAPSSNYSGVHSLPPSEPRNSILLPIQNPRSRRMAPRRASARYSAGSDTSFESVGDDEDTTPEHEKPAGLAAVQESPRKALHKTPSPVDGIQYPKMPRPASISRQAEKPHAPRAAAFVDTQPEPALHGPGAPPTTRKSRPKDRIRADESVLYGPSVTSSSHSRSDSPGSLLAKRRGDLAANVMERGLALRSDANRPPITKKWKVVPEEKPPPPKVPTHDQHPLKSPVWEPKLTPTRRGTELYLAVD